MSDFRVISSWGFVQFFVDLGVTKLNAGKNYDRTFFQRVQTIVLVFFISRREGNSEV
jgi:hypothetical protein